MRNTFAVLALIAAATSPAPAQRAWQTEIGIQGGYTRLNVPGQGNTDGIGIPGFNLGPALPFPTALYVVLPWMEKIALELNAAASQITGPIAATLLDVGLRGNYALASQLYVAAGGNVGYVNSGSAGITETQLAVQGGVGYRRRLSRVFNGRVEARATFWGKTENVPPRSSYSVLVGISTATSRGAAAPRRAASNRAWRPQVGLSAGYANMHAVGDPNDLTLLAFPNFGGGVVGFGIAPVGPPTLFAILPVGDKIAIEPGIDLNRFQENGATSFLGNLSARVNYALNGGWYAGLGGSLNYIKTTGTDGAIAGLNTAVGYRFAISGPVGGRVELNYTMYGKNNDLGTVPVNVMGLMFGAMVPLK